MADITGPISSLPGKGHDVPDGQTCDKHPDRPAVARIQGETDSFGCELIDMCEECLAEHRAYLRSDEAKEERKGECEWCRRYAEDLRDARDYEEGMCGRVYRVCSACIKRVNDEAAAELGDYFDDYDDEPEPDYCVYCYGEGEISDGNGKWRGYCKCADGQRLKSAGEERYRVQCGARRESAR